MIATLKWHLVLHNKTRTKHTPPPPTHTHNGGNNKLRINNNNWTTAFECSVGVLVKTNRLAWRLPYLGNVSSWGNNQIYKHNVMKQRRKLSTHRHSELKKNPVERLWAQLKTNIGHWLTNEIFMPGSSWGLKSGSPWVSWISYSKWRFYCSAWQMKL